MRPLFLLLLLLLSPALFAAGREVATPELGPVAYPVRASRVEWDGSRFITTWRTDTFSGGAHVHGMDSDADGRNLLPQAYVAAAFTNPAYALDLAIVSGKPVIVGEQPGVSPTLFFSDVRARTTKELPIAGMSRPTFAANGDRLLMLAHTSLAGAPNAIRGYILDAEGNVLVRDIVISDQGFDRYRVVADDGDGFLVVTAGLGTRLLRISRDGVITDVRAITAISNPASVAVIPASDGRMLFVHGGGSLQSGTLESAIGEVRNPLPIGPWEMITNVHVVRNGAGYVAVFSGAQRNVDGTARGAILAVRLDPNGVSRDAEPTILAEHPNALIYGNDVAVSSNGTIFVVTEEYFYTGFWVRGIAVSATDAIRVRSSDVLSILPKRHVAPALASDGVGFLSAWSDQTADTHGVRAARLTRNGDGIDGAGIELYRVGGWMGEHAVAFGGSMYLVVFSHYQQLYARRISIGGTVLDQQPILIRSGDGAPKKDVAVAWNGSAFLVAWEDRGRIRGALVSPSGAVSETKAISPTPKETHGQSRPRLAWDGVRFLLVYRNTEYLFCVGIPCPTIDTIQASRVSAAGDPLDSEAAVLGLGSRADVATSGREFVVSFTNDRDLNVAVVRDNLQVIANRTLFAWHTSVDSAIAWTGSDYAVAWRYYGGGYVLSSALLDSTGAPRDVRLLITGPQDSASVAIAANALGDVLTAISEIRQPGDTARTTSYRRDELTPAPPRPTAPSKAFAHVTAYSAAVGWEDRSTDEAGFIVEAQYEGRWFVAAVLPANTTRTTLNFYGGGPLRVRAFNAAGVSDAAAVEVVGRRRSTR